MFFSGFLRRNVCRYIIPEGIIGETQKELEEFLTGCWRNSLRIVFKEPINYSKAVLFTQIHQSHTENDFTVI